MTDPETLIGGTPVVRFDHSQAAIEAFGEIATDAREFTSDELAAMAGFTGSSSFGQGLFISSWALPRPKVGWDERNAWLRQYLGEEARKGA